jgi:REP element-mobilizing transposase RayT/CheY-like chemotaxis protein
MSISVLVVTLDTAFGELLRQGLEETRRFVVRVTGQSHAAAAYARETAAPVAFLDAAQLDADVLEVGRLLREASPAIKLVIVSESGWQAALDELEADGRLSKPFYLPDLLEMMYRFFPEKTASTAEEQRPAAGRPQADLPWLSDVNRAAQHLTRLTLESSAQAALITRDDSLWAYAGQLPQEAAREVTETVARYWDRQGESDLVRFVRLQTTNAEHMLYATSLTGGLVLALIFDAETPFSTIRSQASNLVRSLSALPEAEPQTLPELSEEEQAAAVAEILRDVPPPNPTGAPEMPPGISQIPGLQGPLPQSPRFSRESSPAVRLPPATETSLETTPRSRSEEIDPAAVTREHAVEQIEPTAVTRQSRAQKKKQQESAEAAPAAPVQPRSIPEVARKIVLEPASPSVYNLSYACLLIPRFAQHHLTGDLSNRLGEWLPEICIAFGWRLEQIAVRPDYLQWVVNVPPATSPGYLMRILRQHTSEKIFAEFPRFKKENPSGDFWAPGYLIMGGANLPPPQLVKEFIAQTRQRQGISQPLR